MLGVLVGMFAIGILAQVSGPLSGLLSVLYLAAYFGGIYFLYRSMLRSLGALEDEGWRVFSLAAMSAMLLFPVVISSAFLVFPGVALIAKFLMAPSFLVARKVNVFEAIGAGWRASDGNFPVLFGGSFIMLLLWFVASTALEAAVAATAIFGGGIETGSSSLILLPILLMALSVSAYRHLFDDREKLSDIFA